MLLVCMCFSLWFMFFCVFFFKQKTAYEMRISDWSSDVCSSDLDVAVDRAGAAQRLAARRPDPPPAGPLARLHVVEPVHRRIDHGLHEAGRHVEDRKSVV